MFLHKFSFVSWITIMTKSDSVPLGFSEDQPQISVKVLLRSVRSKLWFLEDVETHGWRVALKRSSVALRTVHTWILIWAEAAAASVSDELQAVLWFSVGAQSHTGPCWRRVSSHKRGLSSCCEAGSRTRRNLFNLSSLQCWKNYFTAMKPLLQVCKG